MRSIIPACICLALASTQLAHAAALAEGDFAVTERGPHYNVWKRTAQEQLPDGRIRNRMHSYTELCTGLYYTDEAGQLRESQPVFELLPGAAVARKTQIQAILAANFNSAGAIDLLLPNGVRLTGHCLGLSYYDRALNKNVLIAEVRDSIGEQVAENSIIYRSAFTDIRADALAQISRSGFSHTVILREN